ncbi:amino acid permease [Rhodotorula diobovata]|uniref:Amino acid permease n=1 Tax=Rhodotorula diobovata TaxID=5288 RepID=A0A5C5G6H9_9BASI|nr:amino acid permease [Rhodotorula diobovata]
MSTSSRAPTIVERTPSGRSAAKDVEKQEVTAGPAAVGAVGQGQHLKRNMSSRHVAMISIGGAIGTGLFLGTATALERGGPLGLFLGYSIMGTIVYSVMVALGEMASALPVPGGQVTLAARFVNGPLGFTVGWWNAYDYLLALPAELSASAVLISYWDKSTNPAVWITVTGVGAVAINMAGSRITDPRFRWRQFWFCLIKVITIIGLVILGIILTAGGGPSGQVIGGRYCRHDPGPFVNLLDIPGALGQFLGFWTVLTQAAFSYIGSEIVALAAAETKNPQRAVPSAIRKVWIRLLLFYVSSVIVIGLLVPSNDPRLNLSTGDAASSPFVIAIQDAGISALPSVINAAILTSAWSAASSDMYTASRTLYGLALQGNAPRILARTTSWGVPWGGVVVGSAFALLAYMAAGAGQAGEVFGWFVNMTSIAGLLVWLSILITYVRFHRGAKLQGIDRRALPYFAPCQPYLSYYGLFMIVVILFFAKFTVFIDGQWDTADFVTTYLPIILFPICYVGVYCHKRWGLRPLAELDFVSGSRVVEDGLDEEADAGRPKSWWARAMDAVF